MKTFIKCLNCVHAYQKFIKIENQQNSKSKYLNAHCIYTPWYLQQANLISKYIHVIYMTSKFYFEPAYIGDYIIKPVGK